MTVGQDVPRNDNASPKGDEGVLAVNLASKVVAVGKAAEKVIAVTLSGGDSTALKEQTEYEGNDVREISLDDIAGGIIEQKESSETEITGTDTTDVTDGKNGGGGNEKDFLLVIGGKLASRDEVGQTAELLEEDFDVIEDLEELLDEQVETFVNRMILDQVQQNDGTLSPEEIKARAMCESASDFEIIDSEGCDLEASDAVRDADVVSPTQVILGWKVLDSDGSLRNLERSASDQHADEEVEEILEALAATKAAEQVHQSREWRALGSEELADNQDPSSYYSYDSEEDIDYDNVVCQACKRSIELCSCADFEEDGSQEKKQIDNVSELPTFEVNAPPDNLGDSCDGDVEDSCSQPDDTEFGSGFRAERQSHNHKGQKFPKNPPSSDTMRPQPRRHARQGNRQSNARDGKDGYNHDSDTAGKERLQKLKQTESCLGAIKKACATATILAEPERHEGNNTGHRNSHPSQARGPTIKKQFYQQEKQGPRTKSRSQQRKQKKHVNKYLLKLQKAAADGDLHAAAELSTFEFKVATEVKDVGFGDEVILHMPLVQLRDFVKEESQKSVHECENYWNQIVAKEKRRLADAFADIYVKNASIKKLNAELDKADRVISGNSRLIDQLEAEVKQLRESKRLRSFNKKKQKQRQRGEQQGNQPRTGSDNHKALNHVTNGHARD